MESLNKICETRENVDLKMLCSYRLGGIGKAVCYPNSIKQLKKLVRYLKKHNLNYFILGNGTNVVFEDGNIEVKYFPNFTKFADESNIKLLKKEIEDDPNLEEKYVEKIVLTQAYAYLPDKKELSGKCDLVKNYKKFLSGIKESERY